MKRMHKFWMYLVCLLLVSSVAAAFVACTPDEPVGPLPATYTITVAEYDKTMGSVDVSAPESADGYVEGESVTVTVTPNNGYEVESFVVSDHADAVLTEGSYTFQVTGNVTITVTFVETHIDVPEEPDLQALLDSVKGSALFEGTMTERDYTGYYQDTVTETSTLYDDVHRAVLLQEWFEGVPQYILLMKDVGGYATLVTHDVDGKVELQRSNDRFAEFYNPFALLTIDDFTLRDDGVLIIADLDLAADVSAAITGYNDAIESFELYHEDGKIVRVVIYTQRRTIPSADLDFQEIYSFDVTEHGTAIIPDNWFADYEMTADHEVLSAALKKAAQATSYTVNYKGHEEGFNDVEYNVYYTPEAIYEDYTGWEQGWLTRGDGSVWEFSNKGGVFELVDKMATVNTLSDLKGGFGLAFEQYDYTAFLESKGYGVFEFRLIDVAVGDQVVGLVGALAQQFATGYVELFNFQYAVSLKIVLKGDVLYQIELDYVAYNQEHVILTFDNWNTARLPIEPPADVSAAYLQPAVLPRSKRA